MLHIVARCRWAQSNVPLVAAEAAAKHAEIKLTKSSSPLTMAIRRILRCESREIMMQDKLSFLQAAYFDYTGLQRSNPNVLSPSMHHSSSTKPSTSRSPMSYLQMTMAILRPATAARTGSIRICIRSFIVPPNSCPSPKTRFSVC